MKIISKTPLIDVDGTPLTSNNKPFTAGKALGVILSGAKEGGKMKLFILAQKFSQEEEIELDEADIILIKKAIELDTQYNNVVSGQLLVYLENNKN